MREGGLGGKGGVGTNADAARCACYCPRNHVDLAFLDLGWGFGAIRVLRILKIVKCLECDNVMLMESRQEKVHLCPFIYLIRTPLRILAMASLRARPATITNHSKIFMRLLSHSIDFM
jgi:hypothetical protein